MAKRTQDITRTQAAELINELLFRLDHFTREGAASRIDRVEVMSSLFDLVNSYNLQVPMPCSGEAHNNPHIDHCGVCMPHWGTVSVPVRVR